MVDVSKTTSGYKQAVLIIQGQLEQALFPLGPCQDYLGDCGFPLTEMVPYASPLSPTYYKENLTYLPIFQNNLG